MNTILKMILVLSCFNSALLLLSTTSLFLLSGLFNLALVFYYVFVRKGKNEV